MEEALKMNEILQQEKEVIQTNGLFFLVLSKVSGRELSKQV